MNMGWLSSGPEGDITPETQSERSGSPDTDSSGTINTASNSNAQILSKLASMDAAHLNQLNEVTTKMAERELNYKEELHAKDIQLQQSQKRVASVEQRIRERDVQLSALREEKSECTREIADLKNQLYQLQFEVEDTTSDKAELENQWQAKLADSLRELSGAKRSLEEALQSKSDAEAKAAAVEQENNKLKTELQQTQRDQSTVELQQQLTELQSANAILTAQISEERSNSSDTIKCTSKEVSNLRATLRARDDTIQNLQTRLEKFHHDTTALEDELDGFREEKQLMGEGKVKERADLINNLTKNTDKLKQELKDMTAKWEKQKDEYEAQVSMVERKGEEIKLLKSSLQERELEIEQGKLSNSRVTALEVELQKMDERVDELTTALNDAVEEIDNLQADVIFKEGRIASLEQEIKDASSLLEARTDEGHAAEPSSSPDRRESGNFTRLRQEIEKITRDRAQLESDHAHQLNLLETSKNGDMSKLEEELDKVRVQLKAETEKVNSLETSLEEMEKSYASVSNELAKTREIMDQLDAEEDRELVEANQKANDLQQRCDELQSEINELRAVQLVDQAHETARDEIDTENMKSLSEQLFACKEEVRMVEAKLGKSLREKEMVISDLKSELSSREKYAEELRNDLESLQLSVERGPTKRSYGMSIDPEWHDADTMTKLKYQVSTLSKEKRMIENELRAKIEARDATIAVLVLSSSNQETSIQELKKEIHRLQSLVDSRSSSENDASRKLKELEASRRKEVESLKSRADDLTTELNQTNRKLLSVTQELECAMTKLDAAKTMPDVQDLAGRLVVSEQVQRMLKTENSENLKERDAAIANLLQSVQANEKVISNLRADIDSFQKKLTESVAENKRLQHESEIFASQIIDQDEEFESLNARLKEKTNEIASLKREIASSAVEIRNAKHLQSQLDDLREEKRHNCSRINKLEVELRNVELKQAEDIGYEVERLKLELKTAIAEKERTETNMTKQIDSLRKLRNHAEDDLREREKKIASLEKELKELKETISEDDFDDVFLDDKPGQSKKELIEERDLLLVKIETLEQDIESLRSASESKQLSELRTKLALSEQVRVELEQDRLQFNANKDRDMDRLHKQLSEARQNYESREMEHLSHVKKLECENRELRDEFTTRIKEKNSKIVALEQTLAAQEQVVGTMSTEMDQLQNGMEKISIQRRAEIEELQQELMDYTTKSTRLEREVMALSMKLEDKKLKHKAEMSKMKEKIAALESEPSLERVIRHDKHDAKHELEEKNEHLKWLNSTLKDENHKMKEKLELLKAKNSRKEERSPSASAKNNDKWRNVALQEQVAVLSQRVIELEEAAAATASSLKRPPQSPRPPSLYSPVERNSMSNLARSSSAPKSVLRVSTYTETNQGNDLLSYSDDERPALNTLSAGTPPALPRPDSSTPRSSSEKSKGSKQSSSRFSLRKKSTSKERSSSSTKYDDASNSTTNYDF